VRSSPQDQEGFTSEQRSGLESRQADIDRTLEAMHQLEVALSEAAPGREEPWRKQVLQALSVLQAAIVEEATNAKRPDSLLSDLARTQPRLRNRARALRIQYDNLREAVCSLQQEVDAHTEDAVDFSDVRQRLGWILTALRHQRARESDLIYEAYFEAFREELRRDALLSVEDRGNEEEITN
jgi:hypothetical protein